MAIGDTIRPELGRTDFTPFMQGSMAGSAAIGQGIANFGEAAGDVFKQIGEAKKQVAGTAQFLKSAKKLLDDPAQVAAVDQMIVGLETAPLREAAGMAKQAKDFLQFMGDQADRGIARQVADLDRSRFFLDMNESQSNREFMEAQARATAEAAQWNRKMDTKDLQLREREMQLREGIAAYEAANPPMSPVEKAEFDKEYPQVLDWVSKGQPSAQVQLDKLNQVAAGLAKASWRELGEEKAKQIVAEAGYEWDQVTPIDTGPISSMIAGTGNIGRIASAGFWDKHIQSIENAQALVDSVTFQSLSDTFPGAISEGERKALSGTEFDRKIDSVKNLQRILSKRDLITNKARSFNELSAKYGKGPLSEKQSRKEEGSSKESAEDAWMRNQMGGEKKKTVSPDLGTSLPKPLQPYAATFQRAGEKYGVNPVFLAAIARLETADGTSSAFRNKRNAMGVSNSKGPISFNNVDESIERLARVLSNPKGPYRGKTTVADIANVYAPVGASNDPKKTNSYWPTGVAKFMQLMGVDPSTRVIN